MLFFVTFCLVDLSIDADPKTILFSYLVFKERYDEVAICLNCFPQSNFILIFFAKIDVLIFSRNIKKADYRICFLPSQQSFFYFYQNIFFENTLLKMVEANGFEPMTPSLQSWCSTNWAKPPTVDSTYVASVCGVIAETRDKVNGPFIFLRFWVLVFSKAFPKYML